MVSVNAETKEGASVTFDYDFGADESLEALCERFGKEIVASFASRALVIAVQSHARGMVRSGKTAAEIAAAMAEWKPGVPRQVTSKEEKARVLLGSLSPEERAKLLKEFKAAPKAA